LIDNILDFSKIEAGGKQYQFVEANAGEIVEDVIRSYQYQITSAGFRLGLNIGCNLPAVIVDRDAISQVVVNLVNNAVKYSNEVKQIDVEVGTRGRYVAIEVADKGAGIPRSEHKKIFEKFYRVSAGLVHESI
jgi:two-component system, OmpR family, phosphate regulon sensor histidine kinase PhoR